MRIPYMSEGGQVCSVTMVIKLRCLFLILEFVECSLWARNCARRSVNLETSANPQR